jgi:hypothetical protein
MGTTMLLASDFLTNTYLSPALRGLEPADAITISGARQIRCAVVASSPENMFPS